MYLAKNESAIQNENQRCRVLIVEDDSNLRAALGRVVSGSGYDVYTAVDGNEAVDLASKHFPQIAILDLGLPGIGGLEVLAKLRTVFGSGLHAAVLSGQSEIEMRMKAFDAGADDFIAKPVNASELTRKLAAAHRMQRDRRAAIKAKVDAQHLQLLNAEACSLLAHDINNGISIALANLQYLHHTSTYDEDQSDASQSSIRALKRMSALMNNFVDVARFEDGVLSPHRTAVDIDRLLRTTAEVHDSRWRTSGAIIVECPPKLVASIDGILIERVLHNLIGNALRYTCDGGEIRLEVLEDHGGLILSVSNTGPTIPDALLPNLFEKYRKGADGQAMRGMGLFFCRLACEAHGGEISVVSQDSQTTFEIRIPQAF